MAEDSQMNICVRKFQTSVLMIRKRNQHVVYVSVVLIFREPCICFLVTYYTLGVRRTRKFGLEVPVVMCTIFAPFCI
jgi:hypothetical protein